MTKQNREIEKIVQDILLKELDLPADYGKEDGFVVPSVYIVAPNVVLGTTEQLQIGIQSIGSRVLSSVCQYKQIEGVLIEEKEMVVSDNIQIDIKSRNTDARTRRFEVLAALESTYAKQMQEKWACRLFQIPRGFINISFAEGSAQIYRFSATFAAQYTRRYVKEIDYYDTFPIEGSIDDVENKKQFVVDKDFVPFE